jgi:O-antigen/teichoic acid export membrane protein
MSRIESLSGRAKIAFSSSIQSIANVIVAIGAVSILKITTHRLSPAGYGTFVLIITYVSLVSTLADLGITALTTRDLAKAGADRISILSITISSRIALSILAIPIIFGSALLLYPHQNSLFRVSLAVMSSDVLFSTFQATAGAVFGFRVRGDISAVISLGNRGLYVIGVILTALMHGSYLFYICAYVGADAITGATAAVLAHRSIPFHWNSNFSAWRHAIIAALPIGLLQVTGSIYTWIDSILVSILKSDVELAYYSIAFNVVNLASAISSFLMQALIPSIANASERETERLLNRAIYILFSVGAPMAVGGILLRSDIILVTAGDRFDPARTPLAVLLLTLPVMFVQNAMGFTSVVMNRYRPLVAVAIGTLGVNIGLNLLAIPEMGPTGAAIALIVSETLSLLVTYFVFRRLSRMRIQLLPLIRPTVASLGILILIPARILWAHHDPLISLLIGTLLGGVVYVLVLAIVRGVPQELRRRRPKHQKTRRWWNISLIRRYQSGSVSKWTARSMAVTDERVKSAPEDDRSSTAYRSPDV